MDQNAALAAAGALVVAELTKQTAMWGPGSIRSDVANGELLQAGMAQLDATYLRRKGWLNTFDKPPTIFPESWSGFRNYGGDVPNLVVAIAFLTQEVGRLIANGESTERLPRRADQPYAFEAPLLETA